MMGPGIPWYLAISSILFSIGVAGVLLRRSPLIVLLSLENMLNAANLSFVGFSRLFGEMDGQIFALIVMVVAACEVAVGLGLIVALFRRLVGFIPYIGDFADWLQSATLPVLLTIVALLAAARLLRREDAFAGR